MNKNKPYLSLAAKMRPQCIAEYFGQSHLLSSGKPLRMALEQNSLHSMILWGPPGTGKTSLARLIAHQANLPIHFLSAVSAGIKELRAITEKVEDTVQTLLFFIDEIHRFNKVQQDFLLPYLEDSKIILLGATTENPSFELTNALLSRARVYSLKPLQINELLQIIKHTLSDSTRGLGQNSWQVTDESLHQLAEAAEGDARRALNFLETIADLTQCDQNGVCVIESQLVQHVIKGGVRRFDKKADNFYEQISALHKAVRGTAPDAALYWLMRILDGGCDPCYIARRVVRMASEDIGNADPRALTIALQAWDVIERLGVPEGELALAQAVLYLACAPKSNAVYLAFKAAQADVERWGSLDVPLHLRNAPTQMMRDLGYAKDYRYPHSEIDAYARGVNYFPEKMGEPSYYKPVMRGLEIKIAESLAKLKS